MRIVSGCFGVEARLLSDYSFGLAQGVTLLRVLNVYSGNFYGGIETFLATLARNRDLCPGIEWGFALCFEGRLADELRSAGAEVFMLGQVRLSRPWTVLSARRRLDRIIQEGGWNRLITHTSWPHALGAPCAVRAKIPLIYWAHGPHDNPGMIDWWAKRTLPNLVIANSQSTRSDIQRLLFPNLDPVVVYCPVSPPEASAKNDREQFRKEHGADPDIVVIVTACRLDPGKGHRHLLDALATLADHPKWTWWVAGGPQTPTQARYLDELTTLAEQFGIGHRTRFLGQRSDVAQLLAAADIHCQPNTGPEGFGIAFIEALYAGLPVITTAIGGALEIVDSTCGTLVPVGDSIRLSEVLRSFIEDSGFRLGMRAKCTNRAVELCSPTIIMPRIEAILTSL